MKKLIIILILFFTCFGISAPISANGCTAEVCKVESVSYNKLALTKDNVLYVIKACGIHHANIVLKQAILETGYFKSPLAAKGNLFGIKNKKGNYCTYRHWSESVKDYKEYVQYKYKPGENYYKFLQRIGYSESPDYVNKLKSL